ncbi:COG1361 S-layer family protein [Candidatus Woesearchaeota archaeon]|nr:COG1361 S-layer family protein [Candidatus Woesearchaeota archaeon]
MPRTIERLLFGLYIIVSVALMAAAAAGQSSDLTGIRLTSVSLVNQDPDPAIAGGIIDVRISVANDGGETVDNLMIEVDPGYPFSLVPGETATKDVGTLKSDQQGTDAKVIKYRLATASDTPSGTYDLTVWEYYKSQREVAKVEHTLPIDVKNQVNAEITYIDRIVLTPGEETDIGFTIRNVGSATLNDLVFSWENEEGTILPVGSDDSVYIPSLSIGETKDIGYTVIADTNADPGLYKLDLALTYNDPISGEDVTTQTIAGVYIGGETDFDVAFSDESDGEISFTVANVGITPASSVSVVVPKQDGWLATGASSVMIGNLNAGDYTVASYTLSRTGRSDGIAIDIVYTDTQGIRHTVEKQASMGQSGTAAYNATSANGSQYANFQGRREPGGMGAISSGVPTIVTWLKGIGIAIVVLILGVVGYLWYRKRRSRRR